MPAPRKLVRGLKDISPLFRDRDRLPSARVGLDRSAYGDMDCISLFSPDAAGDSLFLTSYFASRVASAARPCTILSLLPSHLHTSGFDTPDIQKEPFGPYVRRLTLTWSQWEEFGALPHNASEPVEMNGDSSLSFLEFDYGRVPHFEKIIPVLDKWIVWMQPNYESVSEAYKMLKVTLGLSNRLEYFLLLNLSPGDRRASQLFEQFSELVSRRLGIHLVWLGCLYLPKGKEPLAVSLDPAPLFFKRADSAGMIEKRALADFLHQGLLR